MASYQEAGEASNYLLEQIKSESWFGGIAIHYSFDEGFYIKVNVINNLSPFSEALRYTLGNVLVIYSFRRIPKAF